MNMKVIVVLCLIACVFAKWTVVDNDYETIAISTSFVNATGGYVTGGTATLSPLFLL